MQSGGNKLGALTHPVNGHPKCFHALAIVWIALACVNCSSGSSDSEAWGDPDASNYIPDANFDGDVADSQHPNDANLDADAHDTSDADAADANQPNDGGATTTSCPANLPTLSSLLFDGAKSGVSMGVAPSLGLSTFTLEAWVRRDGPGSATSTGVGGINFVPIASKGRGEDDKTVHNCNYALGFVGEVLGADFEDMTDGGNHPVIGATAVSLGVWHHVAASYDGTTYRLYLDGKLDGTSDTGKAVPRYDSIQHFGLGTAYNSSGVAAGRLQGALAEVRLWNNALSESKLAAGMYNTAAAQNGLVARWPLDKNSGGNAAIGSVNGIVTSATPIAEGPGLDDGVAPTVTSSAPTANDTVAAGTVQLAVDIADPDSEPLDVTFYTRELTAADNFAIAVLPDTQYYSQSHPKIFLAQTKWARINQAKYNIRALIQNGDVVNQSNKQAQWDAAVAAITELEPKLGEFEDGIPYILAVGNHDEWPGRTFGGTKAFNNSFGVSRFSGRSYYGGHYGSNNDASWIHFTAGDRDFVVVTLPYNEKPDDAMLAWAKSVYQQWPSAFGIFDAHSIIGTTASWTDQGEIYFDTFKTVPNVNIMTCGHIHGESHRQDTTGQHVLHTILADYQSLKPNGGNGYLRRWDFSPATNELHVSTFSPTDVDPDPLPEPNITLKVDLAGAGKAPFTPLAIVKNVHGHAIANMTSVKAATTFEWYAVGEDCVHSTRTPTRRFTVSANP